MMLGIGVCVGMAKRAPNAARTPRLEEPHIPALVDDRFDRLDSPLVGRCHGEKLDEVIVIFNFADELRRLAPAKRRAMSIPVDTARSEAFAPQTLGIVSGGFLSLMLSIGHRTRLFDPLAGLPPSSSGEIAAAAGLQERYVREWLGAMVVGRIVDFDAQARTYRLPPEHAASPTRAAGPDNLAELAQLVSLLGNVEDAIAIFRGVTPAVFAAGT